MHAEALSLPDLREQLDAVDRDGQALVDGLDEARGVWHEPGSWSVAECFEHLGRTNRAYLGAMRKPALVAREQGRLRRGTNVPGMVGRWIARTVEPPVKGPFRIKAPRIIQPDPAITLAVGFASFTGAQQELRNFLDEHADLDLRAIRFSNPFVGGIRFSLATGLHIVAAHERRHVWQAWRVRRLAERLVTG
jgi:hypothetical protein